MKAIETKYNGYKFRSRLEARWAVFFDLAGIPYRYEPEGFKLNDGTCYLPDFYLPWFKCYVEIKPHEISEKEKGIAKKKLEMLFYESDDIIVMLCTGDPYDENVSIFCNDTCEGPATSMWWEADFIEGAWFEFGGGLYSGGRHFVMIQVNGGSRDREFLTSGWQEACLINEKDITEWRSKFEYAKEKARQARFEYGESGCLVEKRGAPSSTPKIT